MNRLLQLLNVVSTTGFRMVVLTAILSCSQINFEEGKWLAFRCPDGRSVMARFEPQDEFVSVQFEGRELQLPHVISGSGARYSDGKTTFWNKGRSVLMEVDDKIVLQDCMLEGKP
jgi:membrane-bound inhibitor of C-type lysozyme